MQTAAAWLRRALSPAACGGPAALVQSTMHSWTHLPTRKPRPTHPLAPPNPSTTPELLARVPGESLASLQKLLNSSRSPLYTQEFTDSYSAFARANPSKSARGAGRGGARSKEGGASGGWGGAWGGGGGGGWSFDGLFGGRGGGDGGEGAARGVGGWGALTDVSAVVRHHLCRFSGLPRSDLMQWQQGEQRQQNARLQAISPTAKRHRPSAAAPPFASSRRLSACGRPRRGRHRGAAAAVARPLWALRRPRAAGDVILRTA
jgi:hypothetical protein